MTLTRHFWFYPSVGSFVKSKPQPDRACHFAVLLTASDSLQPVVSATRPVCSSPQQVSRDPRYPAHWWAPVAKEGAPSWEILPQAAANCKSSTNLQRPRFVSLSW
jgi:hypothetical protein